ncbi:MULTISPECIES: hypothetical protein [unclassified Rhizobacter]|uniref:hypothetical protein n=1 Tax=unclassified Rhizobacter TaxID=2640088 RepID=UPI00070120A6|nr:MULTISPECIES: hypothetical protein [unclassified Rhizobacter]KQU76018.1 hypothetical protein ASC88_24280 [Rhizobacter sp. Root29]KQW08727.1 hypothetical protein ASC98_24700 [Rhizobacter sp. Root1238]KRB16297.1 hypothetical protein ASE08_25580 [Rhizobacter sp. Root16D2]
MFDLHDPGGKRPSEHFSGAVGAGLVLVFLPSMTLVWKLEVFRHNPTFGYPILAIFGIMILLGALALVSTLFNRLGLSAAGEALALPPGSIRATIALSLIVLFALLAVMLYQSLSSPEPIVLRGLNEAAKQQLVSDPANGSVQVTPVACPTATAASGAASAAAAVASAASTPRSLPDPCAGGALFKYDVQIGHVVSNAAVDFAKQLLTLIGTLMTSVVSFYFAAKSTETVATKAIETMKAQVADAKAADGADAAAASTTAPDGDAEHEHGGVNSPTDDMDLPAAQGGVAKDGPAAPAAG